MRQFRLAKTWDSHIFFAVQIDILLRQMLGKLLVDDGKGTLHMTVGFLYTNVKGVGGDSGSVCESHHTTIHEDASAYHAESVPIREYGLHHAMLGIDSLIPVLVFVIVLVLLFLPYFRQPTTFVKEFWRKRTIFKIGMLRTETMDVIALGIQMSAMKRCEISTTIDVIVLVAKWLN